MGETFCGTPTEQSRTQLYLVTEEVSHLPLPWSLLVCWPSSHPHTGTILQFSHWPAPYRDCRVWVWCCMEVSPISARTRPDTNTNHTLYIFTVFFTAANPHNCSKCAIHLLINQKKKSLRCDGEDNS